MANNSKIAMLKDNLNHFERLAKKNTISLIEIKDVYGNRYGIGNPSGIAAMMEAAIKELRRQLDEELNKD